MGLLCGETAGDKRFKAYLLEDSLCLLIGHGLILAARTRTL